MPALARPIDELLSRFETAYAPLRARGDEKQHFHGLYLRNTRAVKAETDGGRFLDAEWAERWDVAFANRYLDALEEWERAGTSPGPWQLAFEAARDPAIPPLRHQLVGLNAHLNFDLPQALLAVMSDEDWADPTLVARRRADFAHIDRILNSVDPFTQNDLLDGGRSDPDLLLAAALRARARS